MDETLLDPVSVWTATTPVDPTHECSLECCEHIVVLDAHNSVYACRVGGNVHYCLADVDCEKTVMNRDGAYVCLWSGKIHQYHLDTADPELGRRYGRIEAGRISDISDSSYTGTPADRAFKKTPNTYKKKEKKQTPAAESLSIKPVKIRKPPKPPTPIVRNQEELKLINQQKTTLKRKTTISTALEYLVWNDEIRRQMNLKLQQEFTDQMSTIVNKYIKNEKRFPSLEYLDDQYAKVKGKHEFLPYIDLPQDQLTAVKNQIAKTIMDEYERLARPGTNMSIRFLHFTIGYILLMASGVQMPEVTIEQNPFLHKYIIGAKLLHTNSGQFVIESEKKKKTEIPNITKATVSNAYKDTKALLAKLYSKTS